MQRLRSLRSGTRGTAASPPPNEPRRRSLTAVMPFVMFQSGPFAVGITTLFVWPFLGNVMTKELLGSLSLALAVSSIASPALAGGLHLLLANRLASSRSQFTLTDARVAKYATSLLFVLAILTSAASQIFDIQSILPGLALSCATGTYLLASGIMRGANKPITFAFITVATQILGLLVLGFVAAFSKSLITGITAYIPVVSISLFAVHIILRRWSFTAAPAALGRVIADGFRLVPHLVLAVALLMIMRVLVNYLFGHAALAEYTFASLVIGGMLTAASSLDAHWSVRAQHAGTEPGLTLLLRRNQTRIQGSLALLSILVVCFVYFYLPVWLPANYNNSLVAMTVFLAIPAASFQAYADGRSALFMWKNRPGLISMSTAIGTSVAIILALFLLPNFGWVLAGACITAGAVVRAIFAEGMARRIGSHRRRSAGVVLFLTFQLLLTLILLIMSLEVL